MNRTYRVVVAKPGLDGHDVAPRSSRERSATPVSSRVHGTAPDAEQIVQAVIQEDADALGLSLLSGAHLVLVLVSSIS